MPVHCDNCEREAPPKDLAREQGWYMSLETSVSGIPMEMLCPRCKGSEITN